MNPEIVMATAAMVPRALLTGRHPIRSGTQTVPITGGADGLTRWEVTIAQPGSARSSPARSRGSESGVGQSDEAGHAGRYHRHRWPKATLP